MKRTLYILIFLLALIAPWFLWQPLSHFAVSAYVNHQLAQLDNGMLNHKGIRQEGLRWTIEKPLLQDEHFHFQAESLSIRYEVDFLHGIFEYHLSLDTPRLWVSPSFTKNPWQVGIRPFMFLPQKGSLLIEHGILAESSHPEKSIGTFRLSAERDQTIQGTLVIDFDEQKASSLQFKLSGDSQTIENQVRLHHLKPQQFAFLREIFGWYFPWLKSIDYSQGDVSGNFRIASEGSKLTSVAVEELVANDAVADIWGVLLKIKNLQGSLKVNLGDLVGLNFPQVDVILSGSDFSWHGPSGYLWKIQDAEAYLKTADQFFWQDSFLRCQLGGLNCALQLNHDKGYLSLKGNAEDLFHFMPQSLSRKFIPQFGKTPIEVASVATFLDQGATSEGEIKLGEDSKAFHLLSFGCRFAQLSDIPRVNLLQEGWFKTENLPLSLIFRAFVSNNINAAISGKVDGEGIFDKEQITLKYGVSDLKLDHDDFVVNTVSEEKSRPSMLAMHRIDLISGISMGTFPFAGMQYLDKASGLLFTDISGEAIFNGPQMTIPNFEGFCEGIYFAGDVAMALNDDRLNIKVSPQVMEGTVSQVQGIVKKLDENSPLLHLPLQGRIGFREQLSFLEFAISPSGVQSKGEVHGSVFDGALPHPSKDISFQEINFDFDYNHAAHTLDFSNIQGTLLVGKGENLEEYVLSGDKFHFAKYPSLFGEFDIWIGDRKRDIVRLAGAIVNSGDSSPTDNMRIVLNHNASHFGNIHPDIFNLVLNRHFQVEDFDLRFTCRLGSFAYDLRALLRSGLMPIPKRFTKTLCDIDPLKGSFVIAMGYDKDSEQLKYHIDGQNISIGSFHADRFDFRGAQRGQKWTIDQMEWDDYSLAADISRLDKLWKINFLGITHGDSFTIGLAGEYRDRDHQLKGQINLVEADLADAMALLSMHSSTGPLPLKGRLKGRGDFAIEFGAGKRGWKAEAQTKIDFQNCEWQGMHLDNMTQVPCQISSESGVTIGQIATSIRPDAASTQPLTIKAEKIKGGLDLPTLEIIGLSFQLAAPDLTKIIGIFDDGDNLSKIIDIISFEGILEGTLDLEIDRPRYALKLFSPKCRSRFLGQQHELSEISIEYDPCEFKASARELWNEIPLYLQAHSVASACEAGELLVKGEHGASSLLVQWGKGKSGAVGIQKLFGDLAGLHFNIATDSEHPDDLKGALAFTGEGVAALGGNHWKKLLDEWNVGSGFSLIGQWQLSQSQYPFEFHGELIGDSFGLLGYRFEFLKARVDIAHDLIAVQDLHAGDRSGSLTSETMTVKFDEARTLQLAIPVLFVRDFRPQYLQRLDGKSLPDFTTGIVIHELKLKDGYASIDDLATFLGTGELTFSMQTRKGGSQTLWEIPTDILQGSGWGASVLTPVTGTISYSLKEGKCYLTKFKDVYSEGKMTKFYLANSPDTSFFGFDGHLNIHIRLKPYNLIFKSPELGTLSIQGSLDNPVYNWHK